MRDLKTHRSFVLLATGVLAGVSLVMSRHVEGGRRVELAFRTLLLFCVAAAFACALLVAIREVVARVVIRLGLPSQFLDTYRQQDSYTYLVFALPALGAAGVRPSIPLLYVMVLLFVAAQAGLIYAIVRNTEASDRFFVSLDWVTFLFLISGMAALIYEISWQRVLFAAYGINVESVTIVVSLFMLGLGVGSLTGGVLSSRYPARLPQLFVLCEVAVGLFGLVSIPLLHWVAARTLRQSMLGITLSIYALLSVPTMFMGATLPILVSHLHKHYRDIGRAVGRLYFFNTVGSAIACMVTVDLLFVVLGMQATVLVAAALNFTVGALVLRYARRLRRAGGDAETPASARAGAEASSGPGHRVPFALVLVLSAVAGYLSLSQEILWVRAASYGSGGTPQVFGYILGCFLLGIGFGARVGERYCEKPAGSPLGYIAFALLAGALVYYFSIPLFSEAALLHKTAGAVLSYLAVALIAGVFGSILPVLSHFGIRPGAPVGMSLSWIYMANIAGATTGPLVTGFFMLNAFTLQENILYISVISLSASGVVALMAPSPRGQKLRALSAGLVVTAAVIGLHGRLYDHILEKLHFGPEYAPDRNYKYLVQNRSGIIAVSDAAPADIIYGGGAYDGRFNVDLANNSNGIGRIYMMAALHRRPQKVLAIGLSSGSWVWALSHYEPVQQISVVEINPGYLEFIGKYQPHEGILHDPRISYFFDDGRRWLNRNPDERFDFILMNTTFHSRSNITNLLSAEFLRLCQRHLEPGGVLYYNSTGSEDVAFTAATVFRHVAMVQMFVAASDGPFDMSRDERRENFLRFVEGGRPILAGDPDRELSLSTILSIDLGDRAAGLLARRDLDIVTDDNMLTEFRKSAWKPRYRWYDERAAWSALFVSKPATEARSR